MAMVYHGYQPWLHGVPMVTPVRALHLGYTTHQTSGDSAQLASLSVYLHLVFVFAKIPDPPSGEGLQLVFAPHWYLYLYRNGWICICWELDPTGEGLLHSRMTKCDEYPQFVKIKIENVDDGWRR